MASYSGMFCLLIKLHEYEKVRGEYILWIFSNWVVLDLILSCFEYYFWSKLRYLRHLKSSDVLNNLLGYIYC